MKIGVYDLQTANLNADRPGRDSDPFFSQLEKALGQPIVHCQPEELAGCDLPLVFIGGGGSEGFFLQQLPKLEGPIFLLTTGGNNSLAASLEILSYLQRHGRSGEILHGSCEKVAARILLLARVFGARRSLRGAKLGSVGDPSDWLIASGVNPQSVKQVSGLELVDISMEEFMREIDRHEYTPNAFTEEALAKKYSPEDTEKSLWIYGALKRLCEKYGLLGVTVRCFDLLPTVKGTSCLALAILNAEGIYAGCEGDMTSLISMAVMGQLTGKPVFMCNPSRLDAEESEIVLAHCTLPMQMPQSYTFTTHFESGLGVALDGQIAPGPCTVFKCAGDFSRHFAAAGTIVENLQDPTLCRTQIRVRLPGGVDYFTREPIGNHHLVCLGDETEAIEEFFRW